MGITDTEGVGVVGDWPRLPNPNLGELLLKLRYGGGLTRDERLAADKLIETLPNDQGQYCVICSLNGHLGIPVLTNTGTCREHAKATLWPNK